MLNSPSVASTPSAPTTVSLPAKIGWTILIVATLFICYFSHLGAIGFVGPDEPRYAWIARAMAETGDWVTPRLYGQPWFEKPVLYYWGAAFCFKLFGVSETTARLPSALSALFATLALAWLALRLYGAETARWFLLLLPTTVGMIGFSHAAATDMPFSGMLTMAMVCAAVVLGLTSNEKSPILPRTPWLALFLFGFFLGAAVLAKGPAAIILSGGAIFFWALFTKRWRDAFRLFHPIAIASFLLTALPWYIVCSRRNPDFFRVFIIEHNFKRYLTPEFQHIQPFWYYIPVLLVSFFPWIPLLIWSLNSGIRFARKNPISHKTLFLLSWSFFCVLFFSTSHSKLPGYVLPAIPAIGLLLATNLSSLAAQKSRSSCWLFICMGLTFGLTCIAIFLVRDRIPFVTDIRPAPAVTQICFAAFFLGLCTAILAIRRFTAIAAYISVLGVLILLNSANAYWWELDEGVSARPVAIRAMKHWPASVLSTATTYKLPRASHFAMNYYLWREIREWTPGEASSQIIFTNTKGSMELNQANIPCNNYIVNPAVIICGEVIRASIEPSRQ